MILAAILAASAVVTAWGLRYVVRDRGLHAAPHGRAAITFGDQPPPPPPPPLAAPLPAELAATDASLETGQGLPAPPPHRTVAARLGLPHCDACGKHPQHCRCASEALLSPDIPELPPTPPAVPLPVTRAPRVSARRAAPAWRYHRPWDPQPSPVERMNDPALTEEELAAWPWLAPAWSDETDTFAAITTGVAARG